jgi:DNA-binding NtrC family response regulator
MQEVFKRIGALALSDVPVLVTGESGTGKEMVARAVHRASRRASGPFEPVDCASLPETLFESELFGHERGAFTGAVGRRAGRLERASGGTVFLDEVAEIPPGIQAKLLRFLETRTFERLGGTGPVTVDARVIAATHRDLAARIKEGLFREDLFYRLDVVTVRVPPLRERPEDVPLLVAHFLAQGRGGPAGAVSRQALDLLLAHPWPGNVRELRNAVEHARVLARGGPLLPEHLPPTVSGGGPPAGPGEDALVRAIVRRLAAEAGDREGDLHARTLARFEKPLLEEILARTGGNQVRAARILGIHRTTLRERMERYGIGGAGA